MNKKITLAARILLGLIFAVFGLMGLFNLVPPPPDLPEKLKAFSSGLMESGYFFPLLKSTETICGILLLLGRFVPLALVVLAPVVLNIFLVHLFLQPSGLPMALFIGALEIYLAFFANPYKETVKQLFRDKKSSLS